jgi:methylmalonyl-CoA/ethylmalonyl-CoA epimerase
MSAEPMRQTLLGPVMQLGFVVPDLEQAAQHWASLGVGPFFALEHITFAECSFRGKPLQIDMSVAVAQWGEVQVELIKQYDDTPSIYTTTECSKRGGLQHFGIMTDSVASSLERLAKQGIEPVQQGSTGNGIRFAYVDTDAQPGSYPGCMIELIERGPAIEGFFKLVRDAAARWDGREPFRRLG